MPRSRKGNKYLAGGKLAPGFINARSPRTDSKSGDYAVTAVAKHGCNRDAIYRRSTCENLRISRSSGRREKVKNFGASFSIRGIEMAWTFLSREKSRLAPLSSRYFLTVKI